VAVPGVRHEDQVWEPRDDFFSRRRSHDPKPYRSAVLPEIAAVELSWPSGVILELEDATTDLARLDTYVEAKFGHDGVAPMNTVLLRSESASSSQIENLTVGARQLAIAELGRAASRDAEMVAKNVEAMACAVRLADRLDESAISAMHEALTGGRLDDAGRYREGPVWIGTGGSDPSTAAYVPPAAERVRAGMADLVEFMRRDDLPVLGQAAIAHAQFENLHPFSDGNGRTGRAVLQAMLRGKGLTRRVTVPISAGLLTDTPAYFDALASCRAGDAAPIVVQTARAARMAAAKGKELVDALDQLRRDWDERLDARADSAARRSLLLIASQPAVDVPRLQARLGASQPVAQAAIDKLVDAGILKLDSDRKRNRVWIAPEAIAAMDRFAATLGRRVGQTRG
jgi:Fic family protein